MKKWSLLFALFLVLPGCTELPDGDGDGIPDIIDPCPEDPDPLCGFEPEPGEPYDCENPPELAGLVKVVNPVKDQYIVVSKLPRYGAMDISSFADTLGAQDVEPLSLIGGFTTELSVKRVAALIQNPSVAYVQQVSRITVVPLQGRQRVEAWGIDRVDQRELPLDGTYEPGSHGAGTNVFIVDTGVSEHRDFGDRLVMEPCFTPGTMFGGCNDMHGHGTHVAGTAAGETYGVAAGAKIWRVRVLDENGSGTDTDVIKGIEWVVEQNQPRSVINMSLGGGPSPALDSAVCAALDAGVVNALAAGNDGSDSYGGSPARVVQAITLGASDDSDRAASFSNWGPGVDLFMPGVDIRSAAPGGGSAVFSGTSMGAPHAAGAAALVLERNPDFTPAEVAAWLVEHGTPDIIRSAPEGTTTTLGYVRED